MLAIFSVGQTYGDTPTAAVGYSLGGNMLACYLAESGQKCRFRCGRRGFGPINARSLFFADGKGISQFYQRYLLNG